MSRSKQFGERSIVQSLAIQRVAELQKKHHIW